MINFCLGGTDAGLAELILVPFILLGKKKKKITHVLLSDHRLSLETRVAARCEHRCSSCAASVKVTADRFLTLATSSFVQSGLLKFAPEPLWKVLITSAAVQTNIDRSRAQQLDAVTDRFWMWIRSSGCSESDPSSLCSGVLAVCLKKGKKKQKKSADSTNNDVTGESNQ